MKKGSRDVSLMYAFDPVTKEPVAVKPYQGNMLDSTAIEDFIEEYEVKRALMIFDKGFHNDAYFEEVEKREGMSCIIPLKSNSALIARYGLDEPVEKLVGFNKSTVLYKKVKMANGKWLYATELINFISVVITTRMRRLLSQTKIGNKKGTGYLAGDG